MSGNKPILLVEDDEDQVMLALRALRKHGITDEVGEVVVAGDGEEALDYLFCRGRTPIGIPGSCRSSSC